MTRALFLTMLFACPLPAGAHDGDCNAKQWRGFLGQTLVQLETGADLPLIFRVIYPDSQRDVAPDPARLNFEVDAADVIRDVHCG
ncbi:hypothetical protein [Hasllibacter sp. MH4015]|uniref:hypothetical protein n=1 Tax=Hasllibacter sp. MH4015 TaxID=2854029 RepID=UPI001CD5B859|nr:hypothetical protein [Hasllibacter sp. MH4015]